MQQYVIFDLDGCLSDDSARLQFADPEFVDLHGWEYYHGGIPNDKPINRDHVLRALACGYRIAVFTARPRKWEKETTEWMRKHFGEGFRCDLYMRGHNDVTPSPKLKTMMLERLLSDAGIDLSCIHAVYDDRVDVLRAMEQQGIPADKLFVATLTDGMQGLPPSTKAAATKRTAADVLQEAADTYRERNAQYKSNFKMVGPIMEILFPEGAPARLLGHDAFHLFELVIVKLSRLAISELTHEDSARDACVYLAMIEAIMKELADGS